VLQDDRCQFAEIAKQLALKQGAMIAMGTASWPLDGCYGWGEGRGFKLAGGA